MPVYMVPLILPLWKDWQGKQAVMCEMLGLWEIRCISIRFLFHIHQWLSELQEQEKFQIHEDIRTLPHKAY